MKWLSWSSVIFTAVLIYFFVKQTNNVCKNFEDYYFDRDNNKNCYYNPDFKLTMSQIIRRHGYPVEVHNVTTEDGYILTLFRIPHGKIYDNKIERQPVLLQHGTALNSECFINTGRKSLGFLLADAGYDVWIGNFRGTIYSREHISLLDTDTKYWDFSFNEMGLYDVKSKIDHIFDVTQRKVIYIGYSVGSTASYIYGLTYPKQSYEKVKVLIGLAPVAYMKNWRSLPKIIFHYWDYAETVVRVFSNGEVSPREYIPYNIKKFMCFPLPFQMNMCQFFDMVFWGFDFSQSDPETLPITILRDSDAVSIKTFTHFKQLILSGNFQNYNYGVEENKIVYGTREPPHYNLTQISVPVYLIRAENDPMSTKEDIVTLRNSLTEKVRHYEIYTVKHKHFNHIDFILARDVVPLLYNHLLQFIAHLS